MADQSSKQEELLQFPVDFPMKVMGANEPDFPKIIAELARAHFPDFDDSLTTQKISSKGNYMALGIVVHATSKEQLDNFYRALTSHPKVKVAL